MSYLEELLPEFRKGAKIRRKYWGDNDFVEISDFKKGLIFTNKELEASDWEFYQNSVDWDYIIKNRCLCWFWDDENDENFIARLEAFNMDDDNMRFKSKNGAAWRNCRPVRRDEVTFYEDIEK
jgi:hypothetical protein